MWNELLDHFRNRFSRNTYCKKKAMEIIFFSALREQIDQLHFTRNWFQASFTICWFFGRLGACVTIHFEVDIFNVQMGVKVNTRLYSTRDIFMANMNQMLWYIHIQKKH